MKEYFFFFFIVLKALFFYYTIFISSIEKVLTDIDVYLFYVKSVQMSIILFSVIKLYFTDFKVFEDIDFIAGSRNF